MTNEEKQLLLVDLSARLPYGVKVKYAIPTLLISIKKDSNGIKVITESTYSEHSYNIEDIKPYLRPMDSMTKKETKELFKEIGFKYTCNTCGIPAHYNYEFAEQIKGIPTITNVEFIKVIDWLNAHHFDYRGLIEKGLALEAPEGMYN